MAVRRYWFVSKDSRKLVKSGFGDWPSKMSVRAGMVMKQQKKANIFQTERRR